MLTAFNLASFICVQNDTTFLIVSLDLSCYYFFAFSDGFVEEKATAKAYASISGWLRPFVAGKAEVYVIAMELSDSSSVL